MSGTKTAELYRMVMEDHLCPYGLKSKHLLETQGFQGLSNILSVNSVIPRPPLSH